MRYDSDTKKQRLMGGLIRKALIYFSFYIRSLDLVVAKRKFITSALVKCREHATMKPALWSVAGNLPFLRDVLASLSLVSSASRIKFLSPRFSFSDRQAKYTYEKFLASSEHIFFFFLILFFFLPSISKEIADLIFNCSFYKVTRLFRGIELFFWILLRLTRV